MDELNTALATLIEQATTGIDASVSFLQAELPDVIYQLLLWHGVKSAIIATLGVALIIAVPVVGHKVIRFATKPYDEPRKSPGYQSLKMISRCRGVWSTGSEYTDFGWHLFFVLGGIVSFLLILFGAAMVNLTWLQIWIAPKVWLLEYAANLVK